MDISLSDVLALAALIISVYTSTVTIRKRSQKDFLMAQINDLKNEYKEFVADMRNERICAEMIRDTLSYLSRRINNLFEVIGKEYAMTDNELGKAHTDLQWIVTGLQSVEDQYNKPFVKFSGEERMQILNLFEEVDKAFIKMVVDLNRAKAIYPWDREEENLGF